MKERGVSLRIRIHISRRTRRSNGPKPRFAAERQIPEYARKAKQNWRGVGHRERFMPGIVLLGVALGIWLL